MTAWPERSQFDGIAGYRFIAHIGAGASADTFKAEKEGEIFAVKLLREMLVSREQRVRFEHELQTLGVEHQNLVPYAEGGIAPYAGTQRPFIAMPFIEGRTLAQVLAAEGALPWRRVIEIAAQTADGLHALHEHQVIHRDLKPGNIYLAEDGRILILDFGLAKLLDVTTITERGGFRGTPQYASPEQLDGTYLIQCDIYGLGGTMYSLLTARLPFSAAHPLELIKQITEELPEPPSAINPEIPAWVDRLVLGLLAKRPLERPRSAKTLARALRAGAAAPEIAARSPYDRDQPPLLCLRATDTAASRAIVDGALVGEGPALVLGAITKPEVLNDLHRARALGQLSELVIDTRVEQTAVAGYRSVKALRGRAYLPAGPEPHDARSLRPAKESKRVSRGDMRSQQDEGTGLFRSAGFFVSSAEDPMLARSAQMAVNTAAARDALDADLPYAAVVRCEVGALARERDRIAIANRFAREEPDYIWVEVAGLGQRCPADLLAAGIDLKLILQRLGAPVIGRLPDFLAELAWSSGVAGVELALGRIGEFQAPYPAARWGRREPPRIWLPSIMTSLPAELAVKALAYEALAETSCPCPSCQAAEDPAQVVQRANRHNLYSWQELCSQLSELDHQARQKRYWGRLPEATENLRQLRRALPEARNLRHLVLLEEVFTHLDEQGFFGDTRWSRRAA